MKALYAEVSQTLGNRMFTVIIYAPSPVIFLGRAVLLYYFSLSVPFGRYDSKHFKRVNKSVSPAQATRR